MGRRLTDKLPDCEQATIQDDVIDVIRSFLLVRLDSPAQSGGYASIILTEGRTLRLGTRTPGRLQTHRRPGGTHPPRTVRANHSLTLFVVGSAAAALSTPAFAVTEPESPCGTANLMDDQVISDSPTDTGVPCNAIRAAATLGGSLWGTTCDSAEHAVPEDTLVGAKMVAVYDPPGGERFCHEVGNLSVAREYCAFGTDALGDELSCSWDHGSGLGNLSQVTMLGATEEQHGDQGDDQLIGSRANNAYSTDLLYGGVGEDRECGPTATPPTSRNSTTRSTRTATACSKSVAWAKRRTMGMPGGRCLGTRTSAPSALSVDFSNTQGTRTPSWSSGGQAELREVAIAAWAVLER